MGHSGREGGKEEKRDMYIHIRIDRILVDREEEQWRNLTLDLSKPLTVV